MRIKWKTLAICIAIPLLVGGIAALLTGGGMAEFQTLKQPPLSPPGWLFPVVWTILYILMGVASYLVLTSGKSDQKIREALESYGLQLLVNFFWPIFFFGMNWYWFSFFWLALLWVLILYTIILFGRISKPAAYLLVPYLLWVTFAGYLNAAIALLN